MGLGAAGVKAQVRIGGNTPPSAAAVLDLNATDAANTGTGGLVLPRVSLTSNTMPLTTGVANLTGMMVYNTTATLGGVGIYFWNSANWVQASLPPTSAADSGKVLASNGSSWLAAVQENYKSLVTANVTGVVSVPVTWTRVLDATVTVTVPPVSGIKILTPSLSAADLCNFSNNRGFLGLNTGGTVYMYPSQEFFADIDVTVHLICYRATP